MYEKKGSLSQFPNIHCALIIGFIHCKISLKTRIDKLNCIYNEQMKSTNIITIFIHQNYLSIYIIVIVIIKLIDWFEKKLKKIYLEF